MLNVLKLYAIYVPHITEYIYQLFFRQLEKCISLHRLYWDTDDTIDNDLILFGEKLKNAISDGFLPYILIQLICQTFVRKAAGASYSVSPNTAQYINTVQCSLSRGNAVFIADFT